MTEKLKNENKHKEQLRKDAKKKFDLEIVHELTSAENKKQNTSADFVCKIMTHNNLLGEKNELIPISLKTKPGSFT